MAGKKKKGGSTSISVTFTAGISDADKEKAKKAINKIKGVTAKASKFAKAGGVAGVVGRAVKKDVAKGKERRDRKMKATGSRASASAKLAERKKQKAKVSAIAADKRKIKGQQTGRWKRGAGGG